MTHSVRFRDVIESDIPYDYKCQLYVSDSSSGYTPPQGVLSLSDLSEIDHVWIREIVGKRFDEALASHEVLLADNALEAEDVIGEGYLGVISSVHNFDPDVAMFSTWVANTGYNAMRHFLHRKAGAVNVTEYGQSKGDTISVAYPDHWEQALVSDDVEDEQEDVGWDLYANIEDEFLEHDSFRLGVAVIQAASDVLDEDIIRYLAHYHGFTSERLTLAEIASMYNVSPMTVLRKMRDGYAVLSKNKLLETEHDAL